MAIKDELVLKAVDASEEAMRLASEAVTLAKHADEKASTAREKVESMGQKVAGLEALLPPSPWVLLANKVVDRSPPWIIGVGILLFAVGGAYWLPVVIPFLSPMIVGGAQ